MKVSLLRYLRKTFEIAKPCYLTITHVFCIKLYSEIILLSEISLRINLFYTRERQLLEASLCKYQCWNFKAVICKIVCYKRVRDAERVDYVYFVPVETFKVFLLLQLLIHNFKNKDHSKIVFFVLINVL